MYTETYIIYYLKMLLAYGEYYQSYIFNMYRDLSWEVQIAAAIAVASLTGIAIIGVTLLVKRHRRHHMERTLERLRKQYGKGIAYILSSASRTDLSHDEIIKALCLEVNSKDHQLPLRNKDEKWLFCRLVYFFRISSQMSKGHRANMNKMLELFGIRDFLEREVSLGVKQHKTQAMAMLRNFKLYISPWVINKLLNSKSKRIRRLAMYLTVISSSDCDLNYFETDFFDENCCIYDEIELGYMLQRRRAAGLKLPNLATWAKMHKKPGTLCVFVRLIRRFDQRSSCAELADLFHQSKHKKLIEEISRTWGYLHYTPGEDDIVRTLLMQPDDTKVAMMHALVRMATGRSLHSFIECYDNTMNPHVRFEALRCLYNYGEEGRRKFDELEQTACQGDKKFFAFFHNPITLERIPLDKEQAYHPSVETVYNWASI